MVNLSVPYSSQWDNDATLTNDDCGPACISMICGYYKKPVTTNEIFQKTGAPINQTITISQLQNAINSIGLTSEYKTGLTVNDLKNYLDNGTPVIALVHMGDFVSRQDKRFSGGHFVVVVGYRDDGYFVNDPDFTGQYRADGDHHFYTTAEFETAWADCHLDQNPDNSLLIVNPPQKGTFVDEATFTKLVTKSSSTDEIGHFLNFTQPQIDTVGFGKLVIDKIKVLQEIAFTQNVTKPESEANTSVSSEEETAPKTDEIKDGGQLRAILVGQSALINRLISFFFTKEVKK